MVKIQVNSQGKAYYTSGGKVLLAGSGGDKINIKNGRLYGNVVYNSATGDASNFSNNDYIEDYFDGFYIKNFESQFKFTTGDDVTSEQIVAAYESIFRTTDIMNGIEYKIQNGNFTCPVCRDSGWGNYSSSMFTVEANTTYYVKAVYKDKWYFFMKQNPEDEYVQKQTYNTGFYENRQTIRKVNIGNDCAVYKTRPFKGIVHLNECYIKASSTLIWDGTKIAVPVNSEVKFARKCNIDVCDHQNYVCVNSDYNAFNFQQQYPAYLSTFVFPSSGANFTFYGRFYYDGNTNTQAIYNADSIKVSPWMNIALRNGYLSIAGNSANTALEAGKTYDFKCEWDGATNWTQYIKESTSDTWIEDAVITDFTRASSIFGKLFVLGLYNALNPGEPFTGTLCLEYFKVTQGDTVIWQAVDDEYSIVSPAYPYGQYYSGIATGNVSSGLYEVSTVLGE